VTSTSNVFVCDLGSLRMLYSFISFPLEAQAIRIRKVIKAFCIGRVSREVQSVLTIRHKVIYVEINIWMYI